MLADLASIPLCPHADDMHLVLVDDEGDGAMRRLTD